MYSPIIYILLTIVTVNAIRVLPVTLLTKKITNRFLRSFLYYVPYVTLATMIFPAILYATDSPLTGLLALLAGLVSAWFGAGLFPVAAICCVVAFIASLI